jgi:hypothetical protein
MYTKRQNSVGRQKSVGTTKIEAIQFLSPYKMCVVRHKIRVSCKGPTTFIDCYYQCQ